MVALQDFIHRTVKLGQIKGLRKIMIIQKQRSTFYRWYCVHLTQCCRFEAVINFCFTVFNAVTSERTKRPTERTNGWRNQRSNGRTSLREKERGARGRKTSFPSFSLSLPLFRAPLLLVPYIFIRLLRMIRTHSRTNKIKRKEDLELNEFSLK